MRILFVCLGNICRSPLAEAVFNHQVKMKGLEGRFHAESCGTANYHVGEDPDWRTIKIATQHGVPIIHKGRQLIYTDFENYDYFMAMDQSNLNGMLRLPNAQAHRHKFHLFRKFDSATGTEVPDPYYGDESDFQHVFEIVNRASEGLIQHLLKNHA